MGPAPTPQPPPPPPSASLQKGSGGVSCSARFLAGARRKIRGGWNRGTLFVAME